MSEETSKASKRKALTKSKVYKEFVIWMAVPEPLREFKTQGEFSEKFEVSEHTLSIWKQRDGFWDEVEREWRRWGKTKTSNVIAKFYQKTMKEGTTADIKLWLQYFLDWSEKIEGRIEHAGGIEIIHTYPKAKGDEKN